MTDLPPGNLKPSPRFSETWRTCRPRNGVGVCETFGHLTLRFVKGESRSSPQSNRVELDERVEGLTGNSSDDRGSLRWEVGLCPAD